MPNFARILQADHQEELRLWYSLFRVDRYADPCLERSKSPWEEMNMSDGHYRQYDWPLN
jgi:hypothetical protein